MDKIMELIGKLREKYLNKHVVDMVWTFKVDDQWTFKINGFKEERENIPPFHILIEFNGWPAGLLSPFFGGPIAAGDGANEATFIAALENKLNA